MTENRNTFKFSEHLKSRKEISRVYKHGTSLYSDSFVLFFLKEEKLTTHKFAVSVPKKLFKSAVKRNKIKRRVRESFRLNKSILYNFSEKTNIFFNVFLIYKNKEILSYEKINAETVKLLKNLIADN
ncbi:MAG: ribonuclease P protein component [Bacteroidales bacterium]|nr:ribonuclease P protein component [Bacteroidales bacterium]